MRSIKRHLISLEARTHLIPLDGGRIVHVTACTTAEANMVEVSIEKYSDQGADDATTLVLAQTGFELVDEYEYFSSFVAHNGGLWHAYVFREDKTEMGVSEESSKAPKKYMDPAYRLVVSLDLVENVIFTMEATSAGARAFLTTFARYNEEVVFRLLKHLRSGLDRQTITVPDGNDGLMHIMIEQIGV